MGRPGLLFFSVLILSAAPQDRPLSARIDSDVKSVAGYRDPTPLCGDGEFLRRVMLDLVGFPPNAEEVRAFAANPDPAKRAAKIDELLATERHADFWARRWMAVFFGNYHVFRMEPLKSLEPEDAARLMESFRGWLRERIRKDVPWNDVVRDLLEAQGDAASSPAVVYKLGTMEWPRLPRFENRAVSHFMGVDLSCTGCHDHPFDKWTVEQGYGMMAFSTGRTLRRGARGLEIVEEPESHLRLMRMPHQGPDQGAAIPPRFLNGAAPANGEVLARAFARLMTARENEQFRLNTVNRVWSWLLGRGIVSPVDGFNMRNKPLSPKLLRSLADELAGRGMSLRAVIRGICRSDTYQRRSDLAAEVPKVTFAQGMVRPLSAEQILNSLETATRGKPTFDRMKAQALAGRMAGGDAPLSEVDEARVGARALIWLANGEEVWTLIRQGGVFTEIRKSDSPVSAMFLAALSRAPSAEETSRYETFLKERGESGLEEAYWSLLNSVEFLTRH